MAVNSEGVIVTSVSVSDVKKVLGVSTSSVKELCSNSKINMWAKYKPALKRGKSGISATSFSVTENTGRTAMLNAAKSGSFGYTYTRPDSEYHLIDFLGYNHNSISPFFIENISSYEDGRIRVGQKAGLPTNNITLTDFDEIVGNNAATDGGFGVVYKPTSSSQTYLVDPMRGNSVAFPVSATQEIQFTTGTGTYEVCVFFTKANNASYGYLIPLTALTITVPKKPSTDKVQILNLTFVDGRKPRFEFTIKNISGSSLPSGDAVIKLYKKANSTTADEILEAYVSSLTNGASVNISERYEIDISSFHHWTVTYQGVTSDICEF